VVYTWRFYRRVRLGDARLEPQQFSGFLVEDLGELREYQSTLGGVEYLVSEIRRALFPQEEGVLTIPESRLRCEVVVQRRRRSVFDDFLGRAQTETKLVRSTPIELNVRPLPAPPRGFSGLVGDFGIKARISKSQLRVGESATLQLTISGTGNAKAIGEPRLPELSAFKVYDDKPSSSVNRSGDRLSGYKTFRKALVPLETGDLAVPPVALTYFEPRSGSYKTDYTPALSLRVSPAEGKEELRLTHAMAPSTGKVSVRILADDILPIYKGLDSVSSQGPHGLAGGLWLGGLIVPPLAFLGVLAFRRRQERFEQDAGLLRRRQALRKALATMRRLEDEVSGGGSSAAARLASRCVREFVGDKLGVEGSALTAEETDAQLRQRGVAEELAARTHRLLDRLEAAQYGTGQAAGEIGQLSETVKQLLKQIDRQVRIR
jgi:hypothetical protein